MPKPIFLLLLFLSGHLHGQTNSIPNSSQQGWAVTLSGALIPVGNAFGIQPGVEYRFYDRLSLLSEITIMTSPRDGESVYDRHYTRFRSELRWHFFNNKRRVFHEYVGCQVAHAFRRFIDSNGYYYEKQDRDSVIFFDKARLKSPITTFAFQVGTIIADGRFGVDVFMGFGVRIVHTTITDVTNPRKGELMPRAFHIPAAYNYKGTVAQLHLNAGIRLMCHFYDFKHPRKR